MIRISQLSAAMSAEEKLWKLPAYIFCGCMSVLFSCSRECEEVVFVPPPVEQRTGYFDAASVIPYYLFGWQDDAMLPGRLLIVVDKPKQMVYVYRGEQRVGFGPISSGKSSKATPAGYFRITTKQRKHKSFYGTFTSSDGRTRSGDLRRDKATAGERFSPTEMPYFMRINGRVGLHQGYLPGYPASHGCIRMHEKTIKNIFEIAKKGTCVAVMDTPWTIQELQQIEDDKFISVAEPKKFGDADTDPQFKNKDKEPFPISQ